MEEDNVLPAITATTTQFDGMDYRSISSVPSEEEKRLKRVEEGAQLPQTAVRTQSNLVRLHKRGRMLVASYEAIRFQRLDLFSITLRQIGAHIARMHLEDAIRVIMDGDGNDNPAETFEVGKAPIGGAGGQLSYEALLDFWSQFDPYSMNTILAPNAVMLDMLKMSEFQNPLTGLNFQGTGTLSTPLGATLLRTSAMPAGNRPASPPPPAWPRRSRRRRRSPRRCSPSAAAGPSGPRRRCTGPPAGGSPPPPPGR